MTSATTNTSTNTIVLPPSLAFLVSNFHSLVTTKLDSTNYLLWRIQIENAMRANGYLDYLEGTVDCLSLQVRDSSGNLATNPDFLLWKLIDTQLLSCLTASLSQSTLPYVLGIHHAYELWESLSQRYNSLTKNHVQELKSKLYNVKKTSTMEAYVDLIKEYSQKLAAAGSPLEDDDLIFHVLRGLPPVFNGFKSAVRTRGNTLTFNDVLTMLHSEDLQLAQDSASEPDVTSVLVATHGNASSQKMVNPTEEQISFVKMNVPMFSQYDVSAHGNTTQQSAGSSQQSFMPQQNFVQFSRNPGKGKGYKGGRYPREPCAICGRTNHITNFCYYKHQAPQYDQSSVQWRSGSYQSSPWLYPSQGGVVMPQQVQFSGNASGFSLSQPHQLPQLYQPSGSMISNVPTVNLGNQGVTQPQNQFVTQGMNPLQNQFMAPQAHFTGIYSVPYMTPHTSGISYVSQMATNIAQPTPGQSSIGSGVSSQPWYFDSGATHHITNSLQNLSVAQPTAHREGILVGNGNTLPVTHTGQDNSSNSVQGSMPQGLVSYSELL